MKTIIFDLGGVYFTEGTGIAVKKIKKILDAPDKKIEEIFRASPGKEGQLYRRGKLTKKQFWDKAVKKLGIERRVIPELQKIWHGSYKPIKGMKSLVRKLRKNYRVVVLSGNTRERVSYLNKKYGLNKEFDRYFYSFNFGFNKWDKKFYSICLKKLNTKITDCIFIDDKASHIKTAEYFGLKTILFKNPQQLKRDLVKMGVRV